MPSSARGAQAPDIVLGDRFGASCHASVTALAEVTLRKLGYRVARNTPFAGGHTTQLTGARHSACMRCRSRSIARFTWMSGPGKNQWFCPRSRRYEPAGGSLKRGNAAQKLA